MGEVTRHSLLVIPGLRYVATATAASVLGQRHALSASVLSQVPKLGPQSLARGFLN
jgi:hypothetical protein